jgi:voltage-gated potassium channel
MQQRLSRFINHRITDWVVMGLIVASVALLIAEHTAVPREPWRSAIVGAGNAITGLFVVELSIRFLASASKLRFFRKYWLDIIAVLPILRPLRFLRVLRLLRLARLGSFLNKHLLVMSDAIRQTLRQQLAIAVVVAILILSVSMLMFIIEGQGAQNPAYSTLPKALWWSLLSLSTDQPVGGEPVTTAGRVIELFTFLSSMGLVATLAGLASAGMMRRLSQEEPEMDVSELRDHIILCGWNRAGPMIVRELLNAPEYKENGIVLISELDSQPSLPADVDQSQVFFISADYTRVDVLERAGVRHARMAILLADKSVGRKDQDRDARTVLAALTIEKLNPKIFTCVELLNRDNETHLRMAGVEEIVVVDEYAGNIVATASRNRGLVAVMDILLSTSYGSSFYRSQLPESWAGKTVGWVHVHLKERYEAILVSIESQAGGQRALAVNPKSSQLIRSGDVALVISEKPPKLLDA